MASTFQALLDICERLGHGKGGTATGGSTTTLVDSAMGDYPNDYWNGGTLFILSGDNALTTLKITDFATTTGTFTFATITDAIVSGVEYVSMPPSYSRDDLVRALNSALNEIGPIPKYEVLTPSEEEQETYLLQGVFNILMVETTSQDEEPYDWEVNYYWKELNNRLVFATDHVPTFEKLRIWYEARHARVDEDDDYVSDYVHPDRLAATGAKYAVLNRSTKAINSEPYLAEQLKMLRDDVDRLSVRHPVKRVQPTPHLATW